MSPDDFPAIDFGCGSAWRRAAGSSRSSATRSATTASTASSHSAAFGPPNGPGYVQGTEIVSRLKEVKRRFVETHTAGSRTRSSCCGSPERARRRELVVMARSTHAPRAPSGADLPRAHRGDALRSRARAGTAAWRLAGASLLGPRWSTASGRRGETRQAAVKVAILAGGVGSRIQEETEIKPKPMVEIGGRPILWHIMKMYAHAGFKDFVVALGYKGDYIKRWMLEYSSLQGDLTVSLKDGKVDVLEGEREDWRSSSSTRARDRDRLRARLVLLAGVARAALSCHRLRAARARARVRRPVHPDRGAPRGRRAGAGARRSRPMNPVYLEEIDGALSELGVEARLEPV